MGDLKSFLIDLAVNPDLMQTYAADPHGTLDRAGLSAEDRAAVLSGDSVVMRTALGRPDNDCMSQTGVKVRERETGKVRRLAELLPLEQTVTLPVDIEMTLRDKTVRVYKAGSLVTRHKQIPSVKKTSKQQKAKKSRGAKKAKRAARRR